MHSEQENNSFPAELLARMKAMLGEEEPAFEEAWTVRDDGIEFCIKISPDFQRNGHVCG